MCESINTNENSQRQCHVHLHVDEMVFSYLSLSTSVTGTNRRFLELRPNGGGAIQQKWLFNISFLGSLLNARFHTAQCPPAVSKMKREIQEIFFTRMLDLHRFDIYNRVKSLCHLIYCKSNAIPNLKYAS